jgi:hypothetical protein
MNKRVLPVAALILALSAATILAAFFIDLALANPYQGPLSPETPDKNPPSIALQSPSNKTYAVDTAAYSLTISKPSSWFNDDSVHGEIVSVSYILDGGWRYVTIADLSQNEGKLSSRLIELTGNVSGLSEGGHDLQLWVESVSYYYPPERASIGYGWWLMPPEEYRLDTYSERVYFTIDTTPPTVSVFSPENAEYNTSDVQLNFVISELNASVSYSLDGQENATAFGNVTLTGLQSGEHNMTVYAYDEAGNVGASEIIIFSVAKPEPYPDFSGTWFAPAVGTAVTLGAVVAFSYHTKAKRNKLGRV